MARVERLRSPELFLLTAVALALGVATLSALLGLSPALGAFMAGLLLTETEFDHRVVAEVVPMRNIFATLFFVSVGMLIDPAFIAASLPAVLGMAAFIVLVKALATVAAVVPFRLGSKATVFTGLGMIQIGEFSYVLARAGREVGAVSEALNSLILTSSMVTILLTPLAFLTAAPLASLLDRRPSVRRWLAGRAHDEAQSGQLAEHAIVVGYGRVGSRVVAGLRSVGLPVVVIEEDLHLVQRLTAGGVPAIYGDASQTLILQAAHPEQARLLVVALPDAGATRVVVREARRFNERLPILARAARLEERAVLSAFGATRVVAPELAGATLLLEASAHLLDLDSATLLDPALDGLTE
jgi:monovalent cation:H+ antiporter-2, CPA2 family